VIGKGTTSTAHGKATTNLSDCHRLCDGLLLIRKDQTKIAMMLNVVVPTLC
jgi:hypothetical protein